MTQKKEKRTAFLVLLLIISLAAIVLRCTALFLNFDPKSGYFDDKILITLANSLVIGGSFLFLTPIFTVKKDVKLIASFSSPATYVPTGLIAVAILFLSIDVLSGIKIKTFKNFLAAVKDPLFIIAILLSISGFLAIFHFILTAVITRRSSTERAALGLCAVAFFALYAIYLYFTKELPLNAPNKLVDQMAYLFSALFFLYETRISIGREKWGAYIAFGLIASITTAYSAIPSFIYYIFSKNITTHSINELALTISLFIFITSRLVLAFTLKKDCESPFVAKLREKSAEAAAIAAISEDERFSYLDSLSKKNGDAESAENNNELYTEPELEIEIISDDNKDAELEIEITVEPEDDKIPESAEKTTINELNPEKIPKAQDKIDKKSDESSIEAKKFDEISAEEQTHANLPDCSSFDGEAIYEEISESIEEDTEANEES